MQDLHLTGTDHGNVLRREFEDEPLVFSTGIQDDNKTHEKKKINLSDRNSLRNITLRISQKFKTAHEKKQNPKQKNLKYQLKL